VRVDNLANYLSQEGEISQAAFRQLRAIEKRIASAIYRAKASEEVKTEKEPF